MSGAIALPERRWLLVRGQRTALRVALPALGTIRVGRAEDADVRVEEDGVAGEHAILRFDPGISVEVKHADSGLLRAEARKKQRGEQPLAEDETVRVELGDELRLGSVALSFVEEAGAARAHRAWSRAYFLERAAAVAGEGAMLVRLRVKSALEPAAMEALVDDQLEAGDLLADLGGGELALLLLDAGEARARVLARSLYAALATKDRELWAGMAAALEARGDPAELLRLAESRMARAGGAEETSAAIVVEDPVMREVMRLVEQVAESASPVLILGETGTGKDLIAQLIHERSSRSLRPLVRVRCVELGEGESELAAFIARASGGTVLLDEVGGLSLRAQIALGGLLEAKDVRFLATSNHDLKSEVKRGAFRKDLFFRLNRLSIALPPLRARAVEIVPLAELFLRELASSGARRGRVPKLSPEAKQKLLQHSWPGNVRELKNALERAMLLAPGELIGAEQLPLEALDEDLDEAPVQVPAQRESGAKPTAASLRDEMAALERARILQALEAYPTQADAAKALDIPLRTFLNRLDALGIPRPRKTKD